MTAALWLLMGELQAHANIGCRNCLPLFLLQAGQRSLQPLCPRCISGHSYFLSADAEHCRCRHYGKRMCAPFPLHPESDSEHCSTNWVAIASQRSQTELTAPVSTVECHCKRPRTCALTQTIQQWPAQNSIHPVPTDILMGWRQMQKRL